MALTERLTIGPDETAGQLHDRLSAAGAELMVRAMADLEAGRLQLSGQAADGVTYARKIRQGETRIDFSQGRLPRCTTTSGPCRGSGGPGATCPSAAGPKRVKILQSRLAEGSGPPGTVLDDQLTVACQSGAVRFSEVQRAGGKPLPSRCFPCAEPRSCRNGDRLMPRYKMVVEYDGTPYVGWQRQDNGPLFRVALNRPWRAARRERVDPRVPGGPIRACMRAARSSMPIWQKIWRRMC